MDELTCFKAYDIRGEVGVNLTPDIAFRIGRAWAGGCIRAGWLSVPISA